MSATLWTDCTAVSATLWTVCVGVDVDEAGDELTGRLELATGRRADTWLNGARVNPVPTARLGTGPSFDETARRAG